MEMYKESSLEEGEIRDSSSSSASLEEGEVRDSSSSSEQSDATSCIELVPDTTGCLIQEEMISNLVQSGATPCQDLVPDTNGCLIQEEMISNLVQSGATPCQDLVPGTDGCLIQEEMISNLVQSAATPCQDLVPGTTGCLIQEEMISKLVQFLQAGPCRHIIWGIINGILEELSKFNKDNLDALLKFSEYIGPTTIQTSGGDTSHWTTFCTTLAKNIHQITVMCRPIICDSFMLEKIIKWEAELEKLKKLVQEESYIQHRVMELRVKRDRLMSELYKKSAITIERNGGVGQEIKQHKNALEGMMKELMEVTSKKEEVSDDCYRLGQWVVQSDLDRLQREINANGIYNHVCFTVKG